LPSNNSKNPGLERERENRNRKDHRKRNRKDNEKR
jgi:hypothetical protein